jgi:hypothetical protein
VKRWHRVTFGVLSGVVTASGLLYFWMKEVLETTDPLAVVNHPLQPSMLSLHVVSAPALLVIFGVVYSAHIASRLEGKKPLRGSGLTSLATFGTMALSGYLLPVVVSERIHTLLWGVHIGSGVLFAVSYSVHFVGGMKWRRVVIGPGSA